MTNQLALAAAGVIVNSEKVHCDYSEYLGEDYRYTYDGAGIFVQNHMTPLDVFISWLVMNPQPGMLGKRETLKIPLTKFIVGPLKFLLVGRETRDSQEVRDQLIEEI